MVSELQAIKNDLLKAYSYNFRKTKALNYPTQILIEPTNNCNLNCRMCPRRHSKRKQGMMDYALFKKVVDECAPFLYSMCLHYLGEPLLYPRIADMVSYAKNAGINFVFFSTNATLLDEKKARKLLATRLDNIILSLDGATPATYEAVRRNAHFEDTVRNVERFMQLREESEHKPVVFLQVIKMNETLKELDDFMKRWKDYDLTVTVKSFCTWAGQVEGAESISQKKFWYNKEKRVPWPCKHLWNQMIVTWDGTVIPCCYDISSAFNLGDANKQTILEIWNDEPMQKLRQRSIEGKDAGVCADCVDKLGHSPWAFYRDFGTSKYTRAIWNAKNAVKKRILGKKYYVG